MLTGAPHTGVMVIRLWLEDGDPERLRARITAAGDAPHARWATAMAADPEQVCEVVRAWLARFTDPGDAPETRSETVR
jgi:hypothetical protein